MLRILTNRSEFQLGGKGKVEERHLVLWLLTVTRLRFAWVVFKQIIKLLWTHWLVQRFSFRRGMGYLCDSWSYRLILLIFN